MGMTASPRRTAASRAALAAAIAVLAFAAALPATASAAVSREFWGVVPINELSASEFDQMGAGNVGTMRQLVLWPAVEPSPGQFDWSYLDFVVANSAENDIRVLPFLYGTPNWVKGIDCHGLTDELCQRVPPVSPKASGQWKDFMRAIVGRYGAGGSFWTDTSDAYDPPYEPIIEWQIWNEPSSHTYYQPNPKVKGYAKLVKISHDAITEVDPSAQIVLAGVFPEPEGGKRFRLEPYLSALYRVRGLAEALRHRRASPLRADDQGTQEPDQARPPDHAQGRRREEEALGQRGRLGLGSPRSQPPPDQGRAGPEGAARGLLRAVGSAAATPGTSPGCCGTRGATPDTATRIAPSAPPRAC